ncbi:hypothetical protein EKO27_g9312 [Xylaria grammica]|uniref:Major facilitator superfamily (MFS) profile domain-containing protein n=1 Tax=Xylaria grammica TaxID=363999 RepID=A0A439CUF1_9PEZI|nr:hypothetical protein EKO27_g9312 [Xylaria grammica]
MPREPHLEEALPISVNPYAWSRQRKTFVFIAGAIAVVNSTLGSALPSGAVTFIAADFHIGSDLLLTLPISLYLVGYILGPFAFGPLSETYGVGQSHLAPSPSTPSSPSPVLFLRPFLLSLSSASLPAFLLPRRRPLLVAYMQTSTQTPKPVDGRWRDTWP